MHSVLAAKCRPVERAAGVTTGRLAFWHSFFTLMVHIITSPAANIAPIPEIALFQTKSFGGTIAVSLLCMRFPVLLVTQTLHSVGAVLALVMTVPHDVGLSWKGPGV